MFKVYLSVLSMSHDLGIYAKQKLFKSFAFEKVQ